MGVLYKGGTASFSYGLHRPLGPNEVFSDGERVFPFRINALVEPLHLLLVRRVEFDAWISSEEPLESFIFVVEDLALDVGQPHDLRLDDFLDLHLRHQSLTTESF